MAFSDTNIGFINDSPKYRFLKKQVMAAVKQHGDGLKHLEAMTLKYGGQMLKTMEDYNGKAFDPRTHINVTQTHIMLSLIFGRSTEEDAVNFIKSEYEIDRAFQPAGRFLILDIAPFMRYFVPPVKKIYTEFLNIFINSGALFDRYIADRRKHYKHPKVEVFIDHFFNLNIMSQNENTLRKVDNKVIQSAAIAMLVAGMTTTANTLQIMLAILVNHPNIQDSAYKEIVHVIGKRRPRIEDKLSMPFIQALILETLRYQSVLPLAIPHRAKCDSELQGFLIPAGTIVFPNLWSLHHDERYWANPWEFNPNRFIEGNKIVGPDHIKKQRLLPFGAGRRQCPGEDFARNRLFILATMMLQKFKFLPAEGHPKPNHDPNECTVDIVLRIKPYKLSVKQR